MNKDVHTTESLTDYEYDMYRHFGATIYEERVPGYFPQTAPPSDTILDIAEWFSNMNGDSLSSNEEEHVYVQTVQFERDETGEQVDDSIESPSEDPIVERIARVKDKLALAHALNTSRHQLQRSSNSPPDT